MRLAVLCLICDKENKRFKNIKKKKKLISNHQYHIVPDSLEEIDILVKLLKVRGYKILHNLENVLTFERKPVGLCIDNGIDNDNGGKCLFQSNVTCMGCFCTWSERKPLRVKEIIDNIEKLIDELDIEFYNKLLDEGLKDNTRPYWVGVTLNLSKKKNKNDKI